MTPDKQIQQDIMEELQWEPSLQATEIGVAVKDGVVTLSGHVDTYSKKVIAEKVAKRIKNVKVVAVDLDVQFSDLDNNNDTEIGTAIVTAFRWNTLIPENMIKVKVDDGWVTLEGEVEWQYQREAAFKAVHFIKGVRSVSNLIKIKGAVNKDVVKDNIRRALERNADIESSKVYVTTAGHKVTLSGKVDSWQEKGLIERAAWSSPGVLEVVDELELI